jgi:hypothetical protein
VGDARSTDYSYDVDDELLTIYWRGEEVIHRQNVIPGDVFVVTCHGDKPKLEPMHFPRSANDMLLYILGFGNGLRHHSVEFYVKSYNEERKNKMRRGYVEREFVGTKYRLNVCEDMDGKVYHLASLIQDKLTPNEFTEILLSWPYRVPYPADFLERVFRERFGMNTIMIERVLQQLRTK